MLSIRVHSYPRYGKSVKSTHGLASHMNMCASQQGLPIYMQPKQNTPIPGEDNNISENFGSHEDDKSEEQDIEVDHWNLVGKSSDTVSHVRDCLSSLTPQDRLLSSQSSASLREVRSSK